MNVVWWSFSALSAAGHSSASGVPTAQLPDDLFLRYLPCVPFFLDVLVARQLRTARDHCLLPDVERFRNLLEGGLLFQSVEHQHIQLSQWLAGFSHVIEGQL